MSIIALKNEEKKFAFRILEKCLEWLCWKMVWAEKREWDNKGKLKIGEKKMRGSRTVKM